MRLKAATTSLLGEVASFNVCQHCKPSDPRPPPPHAFSPSGSPLLRGPPPRGSVRQLADNRQGRGLRGAGGAVQSEQAVDGRLWGGAGGGDGRAQGSVEGGAVVHMGAAVRSGQQPEGLHVGLRLLAAVREEAAEVARGGAQEGGAVSSSCGSALRCVRRHSVALLLASLTAAHTLD